MVKNLYEWSIGTKSPYFTNEGSKQCEVRTSSFVLSFIRSGIFYLHYSAYIYIADLTDFDLQNATITWYRQSRVEVYFLHTLLAFLPSLIRER